MRARRSSRRWRAGGAAVAAVSWLVRKRGASADFSVAQVRQDLLPFETREVASCNRARARRQEPCAEVPSRQRRGGWRPSAGECDRYGCRIGLPRKQRRGGRARIGSEWCADLCVRCKVEEPGRAVGSADDERSAGRVDVEAVDLALVYQDRCAGRFPARCIPEVGDAVAVAADQRLAVRRECGRERLAPT